MSNSPDLRLSLPSKFHSALVTLRPPSVGMPTIPAYMQTDRYEYIEASTKDGTIIPNRMTLKSAQHYKHKGGAGHITHIHREQFKVRVSSKKKKGRANGASV